MPININNDAEYYARSKSSFYKTTSEKKDRQKELLEEYLKKRAQIKKRQQELLNETAARAAQESRRLDSQAFMGAAAPGSSERRWI